MRSVQLLAFAAVALSSAAHAKDVTLTFTDQEQQAFVQVLDGATRSGGLAATLGTVYFYNKLQTAVNAANAPVPVVEPKAEPAKDAAAPAPAEPSK